MERCPMESIRVRAGLHVSQTLSVVFVVFVAWEMWASSSTPLLGPTRGNYIAALLVLAVGVLPMLFISTWCYDRVAMRVLRRKGVLADGVVVVPANKLTPRPADPAVLRGSHTLPMTSKARHRNSRCVRCHTPIKVVPVTDTSQ